MKLAKRISLFFLAALAIVLTGFSGSIYWSVRSHLFHQLHELTESALDTLNVAIESGPRGLEWDVRERRVAIDHPDGGSLYWLVFDRNGRRIDGTTGPIASLLQERGSLGIETQQNCDTTWGGETWKITRREVHADAQYSRNSADTRSPDEETTSDRYASLVLAVGTPITYITKQLRTLALTLFGLSVLIWLCAAFLGRWLIRNALLPLTQMASSMTQISAPELHQKLPTKRTGDELEDLSRAFNGLLDRLQVSFDHHRRFAADASHQLRTPLTAMLGQVDVALRRDRSSDEYRRALENVHEQASRLQRIVEMLLFLTRAGCETIPPQFETVELNSWLENHLLSWKHHPRYRDFQVDLERAVPLPINAHEGLLGEVVDNLLDNACKYSGPNSPIIVRTARSGDGNKLIIQDSGHGIAEDELAQVADPFFRSVDAQRRGIVGSGLGLSVVHRIINAFGATISVESKIGRGSTFTIGFRPSVDSNADARDCRVSLPLSVDG